jgi:hypothetical protein
LIFHINPVYNHIVKREVIVNRILALFSKHLFYCLFPCSCRNSEVQFVNCSLKPAW